jgi:hypothetical protein
MSRLEDLPNIGRVLAGRLRDAGIATAEDLTRLGDTAASGPSAPACPTTPAPIRASRWPAPCVACAGTAWTRGCASGLRTKRMPERAVGMARR